MLSLCFNRVTPVALVYSTSWLNFLKICGIFFSCGKKTMKLISVHKNVSTSSHRKGSLMALTTVVSPYND